MFTQTYTWQRIHDKGVRPAGNSRVQHPRGGRNCFTMTTQSLCSVRLSRAMIPTPEGSSTRQIMTHTEHSPGTESRREAAVTISFCVGLSRGPLGGLPDSARMTAESDSNKKRHHHHLTALITWWSRQDRCTSSSPASPTSLLQ